MGRIGLNMKVTIQECLTSSAEREVVVFVFSAVIRLTQPELFCGRMVVMLAAYRAFFFTWNGTVREPIHCLLLINICLSKAKRHRRRIRALSLLTFLLMRTQSCLLYTSDAADE